MAAEDYWPWYAVQRRRRLAAWQRSLNRSRGRWRLLRCSMLRDSTTAIGAQPRRSACCSCPVTELIGDPVVQATEAVYIDSPQSTVWTLLAQMGQDRQDAGRVRPESQHLAVGDVVRLAPKGWMGLKDGLTMCVAEIEPEKHIVLRATRPRLLWDAVWSIHLLPHWEDRVRLLVRVRIGLRHPGEVFAMELARPLVVLTTRRFLIEFKHRVERLPSANRGPLWKSVEDVVHQ